MKKKKNIVQKVFDIMPHGLAGFTLGFTFVLLIFILSDLLLFIGNVFDDIFVKFMLGILLLVVAYNYYIKLSIAIISWK